MTEEKRAGFKALLNDSLTCYLFEFSEYDCRYALPKTMTDFLNNWTFDEYPKCSIATKMLNPRYIKRNGAGAIISIEIRGYPRFVVQSWYDEMKPDRVFNVPWKMGQEIIEITDGVL